ncbi:MAG TPA: hypothetical protein VMG12_11945 [Polyangiaceae bacterium]|nr:hypothetical protein [Polyangiaceae bacterium]
MNPSESPARSIDTSALPAPAQRMLAPGAPAPLKLMAARGIAPGLKPDAIVTLVCAFIDNPDPTVAQTARETLENLPSPVLQGALTADLQGGVLELLAEVQHSDVSVVSRLLAARHITSLALEIVAEKANESIGEVVAASDSVLLRFPRVIEKLYMNRRVRMSTADRLVDLAVRNQIELNIPAFKQAAAAIANQLIPEPTEEPTFDDELFQKADELAAQTGELSADEDTHKTNDEGEEELEEKLQPLYAQLANMTISQKIRRATLGNSTERLLLVRDTNRLVATAAATSPMLNESDAARIAASRNVIDDVLRIIANNRDFTRNYQVKLNLVSNPRTPFTFSSRLIPQLRSNELRLLSKSKNVPAAVQTAARQQMQRKNEG